MSIRVLDPTAGEVVMTTGLVPASHRWQVAR